MISAWKLVRMAMKWQRAAALRRKRISFSESNGCDRQPSSSEAPTLAAKGHFVVYTTDQKRFEFPIKYLSNPIIRELFRLSEEEFGLPGDGPIMIPCDAWSMEHVVSLIQGKTRADASNRDSIVSTAASRCSVSSSNHQRQQLLLCS